MLYNLTTPHLIRNGISKWGISHWNEEYIIKTDGDRQTDATPYGRPVSKHTSCTYKEFFNEYKPKGYYTFNRSRLGLSIPNVGPKFIKDITFPPEFRNYNFKQHIFFAGNSGTGALPHNHSTAVNLLVYGKKKWILFDANLNNTKGYELQQQYWNEYPYKEETSSKEWLEKEYNTSLQKYKDSGGEVIEFIQNDGDVVFIPNGWSHTVVNLDECMGITLLEKNSY